MKVEAAAPLLCLYASFYYCPSSRLLPRVLNTPKCVNLEGECAESVPVVERRFVLGNDDSYLLLYLEISRRCEEVPHQFS